MEDFDKRLQSKRLSAEATCRTPRRKRNAAINLDRCVLLLNRCTLLLHCRVKYMYIKTRNLLTYVRQITQRADVILTQVPWLHHCWHRLLTATITAWTSSLPPTGSTQQSLTSFCLKIRTASTTKRPTKRCALTPTVSRCF